MRAVTHTVGVIVTAAVVCGGAFGLFETRAGAQGIGVGQGPTLSTGQPVLQENFDDNTQSAIWRSDVPDATNCWIGEINHRLELRATSDAGGTLALYVSNAWRFDPTADFAMKVDLQYTPVTFPRGWIGFGVTPDGENPAQRYFGVGIGAADIHPHFWYRKVNGIFTDAGSAPRLSDRATVYMSYNASTDELYVSDSGYGRENAWMAIPGLVQGEWGGKPMHLWLGGSAGGLALASGQAFLDNLVIESGSVLEASLRDVYRFWSPCLQRHFYTIDIAERDSLAAGSPALWTYEGSVFAAFADDRDPACRPVYRFWSDKVGGHLYTIDEQEKNTLLAEYWDVWTFEGVAFYAYPSGLQPKWARPVYRFSRSGSSAEFYTIDPAEKENLLTKQADVWTYGGVAWYAISR